MHEQPKPIVKMGFRRSGSLSRNNKQVVRTRLYVISQERGTFAIIRFLNGVSSPQLPKGKVPFGLNAGSFREEGPQSPHPGNGQGGEGRATPTAAAVPDAFLFLPVHGLL